METVHEPRVEQEIPRRLEMDADHPWDAVVQGNRGDVLPMILKRHLPSTDLRVENTPAQVPWIRRPHMLKTSKCVTSVEGLRSRETIARVVHASPLPPVHRGTSPIAR